MKGRSVIWVLYVMTPEEPPTGSVGQTSISVVTYYYDQEIK